MRGRAREDAGHANPARRAGAAPRIIVPPDPELTPPPPIVTEVTPKPQTPARRPAAPRPETKIEAPKPADPPVAAAVPSATLQQALPTTAKEAERLVREQLTRAKEDLKRVSYGTLGADAKSQYDTANRFVAQAELALREGNLVFAAKVAEKAAGLAASLPVR